MPFRRLLQSIAVIIVTIVSWLVAVWIFSHAAEWSRLGFVLAHYLTLIIVFSFSFGIYYQLVDHSFKWQTIGIALLTLIVFQLAYYTFINPDLSYLLTLTDWVIPLGLTTAVIYSVREVF